MGFISRLLAELASAAPVASLLLKAILVSLAGIFLLVRRLLLPVLRFGIRLWLLVLLSLIKVDLNDGHRTNREVEHHSFVHGDEALVPNYDVVDVAGQHLERELSLLISVQTVDGRAMQL